MLGNLADALPEDVSVVGYDDVEPAAHSFPPLTTVCQPMDLAGVALVECLVEAIAGGQPRSRILTTELVLRESTAPAGAGA